MNTVLIIFMVLAVLATLGALARGIFIMASGKDLSGEKSNRMMVWRVGLQATAIVLVILLILLNRS